MKIWFLTFYYGEYSDFNERFLGMFSSEELATQAMLTAQKNEEIAEVFHSQDCTCGRNYHCGRFSISEWELDKLILE